MSNNLELWNKVEKTNPKYTKEANVKGNKITSIAPQFQILNATEQFGVYGVTWGFKNIKFDYTLVPVCGLVSWSADFFFPKGEFPATNSISIWRDGAMTKADDQFAKKVETDALTKCLSKLGFNADIFLGKFDDVRYLEEVKKEFAPKPIDLSTTAEGKALKECKTIEKLGSTYLAMSKDNQTKFKKLVTDFKLELSK
tara:strand:+ start:707 stop:1300 length:594 start_codon:yes stop_codon:yes gene_type:complete